MGIDEVQDKLEYIIRGQYNPIDYFGLFRKIVTRPERLPCLVPQKIVAVTDDHNQVRKGKTRLVSVLLEMALGEAKPTVSALVLNLCALGIPCVYYGSKQAFGGAGDGNTYIREAIFSGDVGPFRSRDGHCFDAGNPIYQQLAKVIKIQQGSITLRRRRQHLREISADGLGFGVQFKMGGCMSSQVA